MEQHMEFLEYPKALYLSGQALIVDNDEQEHAARGDGYDDWHADHARTNGADDAPADVPELTRDELKAKAAELGITHAPNIGTDKLAALVAAHEG
jgi:hypothetical protein